MINLLDHKVRYLKFVLSINKTDQHSKFLTIANYDDMMLYLTEDRVAWTTEFIAHGSFWQIDILLQWYR
jgi:hypothetical protein